MDKHMQQKDALAFLDGIRQEYPNDEEVFDTFLNIMADFKSKRIGTKEVLERTTKLFGGHPSLINKFIEFLPPGHVLNTSSQLNDIDYIEITTPSGDRIIVNSTEGTIKSA
ncbi:hypothetical protein BDB01DRAFT_791044 [Pilobolus umbonatus]|nr:hypothetical protein BDB01DRAFT_791044 [Pilobolus umbonatus]